MPTNLNYVIDQVGKDKGIDRKVIIEALEQAVLTASRKKYGHQGEIEVHYNEEAGEVELFQFKQVVEEVESMVFDCHVHLPSPGLGKTWEWQPFTPDLRAAARRAARTTPG